MLRDRYKHLKRNFSTMVRKAKRQHNWHIQNNLANLLSENQAIFWTLTKRTRDLRKKKQNQTPQSRLLRATECSHQWKKSLQNGKMTLLGYWQKHLHPETPSSRPANRLRNSQGMKNMIQLHFWIAVGRHQHPLKKLNLQP